MKPESEDIGAQLKLSRTETSRRLGYDDNGMLHVLIVVGVKVVVGVWWWWLMLGTFVVMLAVKAGAVV